MAVYIIALQFLEICYFAILGNLLFCNSWKSDTTLGNLHQFVHVISLATDGAGILSAFTVVHRLGNISMEKEDRVLLALYVEYLLLLTKIFTCFTCLPRILNILRVVCIEKSRFLFSGRRRLKWRRGKQNKQNTTIKNGTRRMNRKRKQRRRKKKQV